MGPAVSTIAAPVVSVELLAARSLYHANKHALEAVAGNARTAGVALATATTSALSEARSLWNNRITEAFMSGAATAPPLEHIRVPLAAAAASTATASLGSAAAFKTAARSCSSTVWNTIVSLARSVGGKIGAVFQLLIKNPKLLAAGGVGIVAVAGLSYLVVTKVVPDRTAAAQQAELYAAALAAADAPDHLCCPITSDVFVDPVIVATGQTYERSAISEWLRSGNGTCPMTRKPITQEELIPNIALRQACESFKASRNASPVASLS